MIKFSKKKVILVGAFILYAVIIGLATGFITKKYIIKPKADLINYKIIDIISYKQHEGDLYVAKYSVKINEHDYIMIDNKVVDNIMFQHIENCSYCKKHKLKLYNDFCFTIKDGNTSDIMTKLHKMRTEAKNKK